MLLGVICEDGGGRTVSLGKIPILFVICVLLSPTFISVSVLLSFIGNMCFFSFFFLIMFFDELSKTSEFFQISNSYSCFLLIAIYFCVSFNVQLVNNFYILSIGSYITKASYPSFSSMLLHRQLFFAVKIRVAKTLLFVPES